MDEINVNQESEVLIITDSEQLNQLLVAESTTVEIITVAPVFPPGSGSDETYIHDQTLPATTWIIYHQLNRYPSVTVVDSSKRECIAQVQYIDNNTIHITVTNAFSGQAFLN